MRIAYVTSGAGGMYCGSCLRDNTLAAELMRQGHEVTLIPTYTPTRTDEPNVSDERVFLGGINVYLQQRASMFRATPRFLDRVLDSPALLRLASRGGVQVDPSKLGDLTISILRGSRGNQRKEMLRLAQFVRELRPEVINLSSTLLLGLAPEVRGTEPL